MGDHQQEPLPMPAVIVNTEKPPPSLAAKILEESLLAALITACCSAAFAAYDHYVAKDSPDVFLPCYRLGAADVDTRSALVHRLLWCSLPQGVAAALAMLLEGCRTRQALAFVALKATAANYWFRLKIMALFRVEGPCNILFAFDAASLVVLAVLDLLGLLAVLMGEGGEEVMQDQVLDPDIGFGL